MANNNSCGCRGRRNSNNNYGCLNSMGGRWPWNNYPYYNGPCPDEDGIYGCYREDGGNLVRGNGNGSIGYGGNGYAGNGYGGNVAERERYGMFVSMLPMAVSANGIVPLVNNNLCKSSDFPVNSGLITIDESGTYLATYTVRLPAESTLESTFTLNVNDASQSSAITEVGGTGPMGFTSQAIFDVCDHATVALRSSEAISITESSPQPLVTMSLVKL